MKTRKTTSGKRIKAWLVTWEWSGAHAKREDKVAAVFDPRFSGGRVVEFVEFLYLMENSSLNEKVSWGRDRSKNPYPAVFGILDGGKWEGQITCGHNPFLFARLVDDLEVHTDPDGKQMAKWKERPKPDLSWTRATKSKK